MKSSAVPHLERGFTLIGMLIIMIFFMLMMGVISISTQKAEEKAKVRDTQRIAQLEEIQTALSSYYTTHGNYPEPTELYSGWERSECSPLSCTEVPAPFMEYLTGEMSIMSDPSTDLVTLGYEPLWGYLYQSEAKDGYQTYCLMTHLETDVFQDSENDADCDDDYADDVLTTGGDVWWYAVSNSE